MPHPKRTAGMPQLVARVTPDEYAYARSLAKAEGVSLAEWIRRCSLGQLYANLSARSAIGVKIRPLT
jgi:predicted HicB family RNase H-like nuclease